MRINVIALMLIMILFANESYSVDIVKLHRQKMSDNKTAHNADVIKRSLEVTESEYGPFKLEVVNVDMSVNRMLKASIDGEIINTAIVPANVVWDTNLIPIEVPVRLGLLSYRILLINKQDRDKFKKVNDFSELNNYTAGLLRDWETTKIFKFNHLKFIEAGHYNGVFLMLDKGRFDYIPRGVYEIYDELNARQTILENVVVEKNLVLYIPTSAHVYVSKSTPRIGKRIESGLHKLLASGELKELLYKHYDAAIKQADLAKRRIIEIKNPYYQNNKINDEHFLHVN